MISMLSGMMLYFAKFTGEDLSCYLNKTESVGFKKKLSAQGDVAVDAATCLLDSITCASHLKHRLMVMQQHHNVHQHVLLDALRPNHHVV